MNNLRMRKDNLLLRVLELDKVSAGGIHLVAGKPGRARTLSAQVVSKGELVDDKIEGVDIGDRVVISSLAGQDLSYDSDGHTLSGLEIGVDYRAVRADEVLCVLGDEVSYG